MDDKILTIIVPTYNMELYLGKCLASLVVDDEELKKMLEVLVIIDGATDRSSTIAHTYQSRYPEMFVVIDKENGNYGSCINVGIQRATGKYVKVLDADDSFDTPHFEDYLRFLTSMDVDLIITPYTVVDESGKECRREVYDLPVNTLLSWQQLTAAFKTKSLQMHAVTYKLKNILEIRYRQTEGISYTDQEWIFTPMTTVRTAIAYSYSVYKYLVGRAGQTINPETFRRNISQNEQCCRRIVRDYMTFNTFEPAKQEFVDYKLTMTMKSMYNWYLLDYPDLDINGLVEFDDFLNSVDASFAEMLDAQVIKHTHYPYIKRWHEDRTGRRRLAKLLYMYSRGVDKVMRIFN